VSDETPEEGTPTFLTVEQVLVLHERQLQRFGGGSGLRDLGLLESAVAQPQTSFGGTFAHDGPFAMAAAYLFHIASNHPFVDGNKRVGLLAAASFLHINGIRLVHGSGELYELTMGVAEGRVDKATVTAELVRIAKLGRNRPI
jgi:death on curing protein